MSEPFVRPDARAYLDALAANPRPTMSDALIAQMRMIPPEIMAGMLEVMELPVGEIATVADVTMPGPGGDIALRMFDARPSRDPGPVVVFYHGGGFVVGSIDTHAALAAEIARLLDLPVISIEYRLAPEHKWPAAPDDAEAATRWIAENGQTFGREFTGLVLCGDSAGGNLALVVALDLRERPAALPLVALIPIYPKTDSSRVHPSFDAFTDGFGLPAEDMAYFEQAFSPDPHSHRHSVMLADLAGLPATLMVTCSLDVLRDEGRAFAAKAVEAGVPVIYREMQGNIHGCFTFRKAIPSAQQDLVRLMELARTMIAEVHAGHGLT
ncbi:MAG: alpha/beta hydrolase [Novosphingobium sp.]